MTRQSPVRPGVMVSADGAGRPQKDLLVVEDLKKHFAVRGGVLRGVQGWVQAVDGVSFTIKPGETFGLVGESGCGKTTVGRTILRLTPATAGRVIFDGRDVFALPRKEMTKLRADMQLIFQDPFSSLDPRMPIGAIISEGLAVHGVKDPRERRRIVAETLDAVGMSPGHARRYPHEFSGGQRQRIGIARALALRPRFIVCDEPISALDVSIQSQILNLLSDLQAEFGLTYLFVAHNLSVIEHFSDRVGVMYLGKLVELTDRQTLYEQPLHPYTRALMSAIPIPDPRAKRERIILPGDVPSPLNPPAGCRFHPRCPLAEAICKVVEPRYIDVGGDGQEHRVACHVVHREFGIKLPEMPKETVPAA